MPRVLDNSQRFRFAITFQWVVVGISLVAIAAETAQYQLVKKLEQHIPVSRETIAASDWRLQVVNDTRIVLILMTFIALILWLHRAYGNLHRLHRTPAPKHEAGAAGWSWFVPILNLWYPFQIMKEVWYLTQRYTQADSAWVYKRDGSLIGGWWLLHLVGFFAGVGVRPPGAGAPFSAFHNYSLALIGLEVLGIWYAIVTVYLLQQVRPFERELVARFASGEAGDSGGARPEVVPAI